MNTVNSKISVPIAKTNKKNVTVLITNTLHNVCETLDIYDTHDPAIVGIFDYMKKVNKSSIGNKPVCPFTNKILKENMSVIYNPEEKKDVSHITEQVNDTKNHLSRFREYHGFDTHFHGIPLETINVPLDHSEGNKEEVFEHATLEYLKTRSSEIIANGLMVAPIGPQRRNIGTNNTLGLFKDMKNNVNHFEHETPFLMYKHLSKADTHFMQSKEAVKHFLKHISTGNKIRQYFANVIQQRGAQDALYCDEIGIVHTDPQEIIHRLYEIYLSTLPEEVHMQIVTYLSEHDFVEAKKLIDACISKVRKNEFEYIEELISS